MVNSLGFGSYIGGILLGILAVILIVFSFAVMLGFVSFVPKSLDLPFGIVILIIALVLLLYGWYTYQSSKPKGTINVHNV